jgi:hypothetical protein
VTHEMIDVEDLKARKRQEGQQKEEQAQQEAPATYEALRGGWDVSTLTVPVECPISPYKEMGLVLHYRTSNPSRRRRERPIGDEPVRVQELRIARDNTEPNTPERNSADQALKEALEEYNADLTKRLCHWLSVFLKGITPWPFKRDGQPIPPLDPAKPETYEVLAEEFEDLFIWSIDMGYKQALQKSLPGNA